MPNTNVKCGLGSEHLACALLIDHAGPCLCAEALRLRNLINSPHVAHFLSAVQIEAAHQRERWTESHDVNKTDADWFWLIGYLAGKAISKPEKVLHHIITTAAALLNWHAAKTRSGV